MEHTLSTGRRLHVLASHLASSSPKDADELPSLSFEQCYAEAKESFPRRHSRMLFARPREGDGPLYTRCSTTTVLEQYKTTTIRPHRLQKKTGDDGGSLQPAAAETRINSVETSPLFARPSVLKEPKVKSAGSQLAPSSQLLPEPHGVVETPNYARPAAEVHESEPKPHAGRYGDARNSWKNKKDDPQYARQAKKGNARGEYQWAPRMDVLEGPAAYLVMLELPGVGVDSIRVEISGGKLLITGTCTSSDNEATADVKLDSPIYHMRERATGPYRTSWQIPTGCNLEAATAEFSDGVLRVLFPKLNVD